MAKLSLKNVDFAVQRMIEQCPKHMMLRELIKNALEAAVRAVGKKEIRIGECKIAGVPKLRVWNTGRGMNAAELRDACELSSSVGKEQGLDGNFGIGAKVASLSSNRKGMRYRSCRDGRVSEVLIQDSGTEDSPNYERADYSEKPDKHTGFKDVSDVTKAVQREGGDTSFDWTEVVLIGNEDSQDTVRSPYGHGADERVDPSRWIANGIYERFYRLPEEIKLIFESAIHRKQSNRTFHGFLRRMEKTKEMADKKYPGEFRSEVVTPEGEGLTIRYYYDGPIPDDRGHNLSYIGNIASARAFCAIGYRDELYDFRTAGEWHNVAPKMDVHFGSRHISIIVELPDDADARPTDYRTGLQQKTGIRTQLRVEHYAHLVKEHMPEWLRQKIRSHYPNTSVSDDVKRHLQDLIQKMAASMRSPRATSSGSKAKGVKKAEEGEVVAPTPDPDSDPEPGTDSDSEPAPVPGPGPVVGTGKGPRQGGRVRRSPAQTTPEEGSEAESLAQGVSPPTIFMVDGEKAREEGLSNRAAKYVEANNHLLINTDYPAFQNALDEMNREYESALPQGEEERERARSDLRTWVGEAFQIRIGRAVVLAQAKKWMGGWDETQVEGARSPEALSTVADDYDLATARKKASRRYPKGAQKAEEADPASSPPGAPSAPGA